MMTLAAAFLASFFLPMSVILHYGFLNTKRVDVFCLACTCRVWTLRTRLAHHSELVGVFQHQPQSSVEGVVPP